ncbi:MAG: hypothetical protein AAB352_01835 [Patescibacteria group bacterium]
MQKKTSKNLAYSVNDLILFCIYYIISNNEECSFDRLVKECFILFPDAIKFQRYPVWPDSRKLDRPLRSLRNEGFIIGDPTTIFMLTKNGEAKALSVAKALRQGKLL